MARPSVDQAKGGVHLGSLAAQIATWKVTPHSSIVVYGKEFEYGQRQGVTISDNPRSDEAMNIFKLGETNKTEQEVKNHVDEVLINEKKYTSSDYNLTFHNCHKFSNHLSLFAVEKEIPDEYKYAGIDRVTSGIVNIFWIYTSGIQTAGFFVAEKSVDALRRAFTSRKKE